VQKVFYIHVPKTAGSSLYQLFRKNFDKTLDHLEGKGPFNETSLKDYDAVSAHLSYTRVSRILNLKKWISVATFREPYSHVISHICWVRKLADKGEKKRFKAHPKQFQDLALYMKTLDFSKPADIEKLISHFESIDFHYFHNTQTIYMDANKNLDQAFLNLEQIDILGLTESMDAFYSRLHYILNWVGNVLKDKVFGWGKYLSSDKPAKAELYINDELREVKVAKDFRQHVFDSKKHSTGKCGFEFDLSGRTLADGDKISVKLSEDKIYLKNSGWIFVQK